jgi:dolichol-phosphate mannosyltransferase
MVQPKLSIIVPAYKEEEALRKLLPLLLAEATKLDDAVEILVIDSRQMLDDTGQVCRDSGVRHIRRRGGDLYGDAVRTGIEEAQGKYILLMDADGSHNPAHIRRLWAERANHDVVIGSRYVDQGATENPRSLVFMSWVVNVIFRVVFRLHCKDVSNSFRLYRAEVLKPLHLRSRNFDVVEELLILLSSKRIIEVPITFEKRKAGKSKRNLMVFAISYLWTLARLYWIRPTKWKNYGLPDYRRLRLRRKQYRGALDRP